MDYSGLYSAIYDFSPEETVAEFSGRYWSLSASGSNVGIAMFTEGFETESMDLARANCHWNRGSSHFEDFENYCTAGIDFSGKTVGVVGHLGEVGRRHGKDVRKLYYFDIHPKEGDLPVEMEDEILPECDIAIITGSSIQNGTLPHLLELCGKSYVILTGPSVPKCPALLDFGIHRIAGMSVSDPEAMFSHVRNSVPGTPYIYGTPFLISR